MLIGEQKKKKKILYTQFILYFPFPFVPSEFVERWRWSNALVPSQCVFLLLSRKWEQTTVEKEKGFWLPILPIRCNYIPKDFFFLFLRSYPTRPQWSCVCGPGVPARLLRIRSVSLCKMRDDGSILLSVAAVSGYGWSA